MNAKILLCYRATMIKLTVTTLLGKYRC